MSRHILQGLGKCRELIRRTKSEPLYFYDSGPFTSHSLIVNRSWQMATVALRRHNMISSVAVKAERNHRTKVALATRQGADADRVPQAMDAMKQALEKQKYHIKKKPGGDNPHYYYVYEKGTSAETASHKNRVARLTYNAAERQFEIEAYEEHAEGIIKALFNGKKSVLPVERTLFDNVAVAAKSAQLHQR